MTTGSVTRATVPVRRGRAADLWVRRHCGCDLAGVGLTSGGVALSYAIGADTVTASAPAGDVFTFHAGPGGGLDLHAG